MASNKKLLGDLIDLSNKSNKQSQLANKINKTAAGSFKASLQSQSTVSPLTNRSNTTPKSSLDATRNKTFDMDLQHHQSLNNSNKRRTNSSSGAANLNARRKSNNNKVDSLGGAPLFNENDNGLVSSQTDSNNNKKLASLIGAGEWDSSTSRFVLTQQQQQQEYKYLSIAQLEQRLSQQKGLTSPGASLATGTVPIQSPSSLINIFNELRDYEEELRLNQVENLDGVLSETRNRLSTSNDKDGYWCFKRKEGCKYLPVSSCSFPFCHFNSTFV